MKALRMFLIVTALGIPFTGQAATVYYITMTGTGAQTQIDLLHTSMFENPGSTPTCPTTDCATFEIGTVADPFFSAPTFDWEFGGGSFQMKKGSSSSADITFALYDTSVNTGPIASVTFTEPQFCAAHVGNLTHCQNIAETDFFFTNPVTIQSGHEYYATLTSLASTQSQNDAYFIKGDQSDLSVQTLSGTLLQDPTTNDPPPVVNPEPGTWALLAGGMGMVVFGRVCRQRTS